MFGTVVLFIIGVIYLLCQESKAKAESDRKLKEAKARGLFRRSSASRHDEIYHEICDAWFNEYHNHIKDTHNYFPEEYKKYFAINEDARYCYISSKTAELESKEGLCPFWDDYFYDQRNYNPYNGFEVSYGAKIREFNRTGIYNG